MPKTMRRFCINKLKTAKASAGFTLIELLAAVSLTTVVVGAAGFGVVTIMNANAKSESKTQRRVELNRALDYIAGEVRQAEAINKVSPPASSEFSASTIVSGTDQTVLVLDLPKLNDPIVYRVAQPRSSVVWQGPRVIYRWGPNMNANGTYSDPNNSTNWTNRALIDFIEDKDSSPDCDASWDESPAANPKGFYACIESTPSGDSRIAEIHLIGELSEEDSYNTSSKVFARSANP